MVRHTRHVSTDDAGPTAGTVAGPDRGSDTPALDVNGTRRALDAGTTVADLVARWCRSGEGPSPKGIAVARNGEVVPRSEWTATMLAAGDRVEIVTAAAGG